MGSSGKSGGTASPLTTKGDAWGFSTVNARIPIGSDTQVLTADSTQTLGLKWAAAGAGLPAGTNQNWLEATGASSYAWLPATNEMLAGALVNATSAGDAGGRSDHFLGSSLNAKWTVHTHAQAQSIANSVLQANESGGTAYIDQPFTPSGNFRVEARINGANGAGLACLTTANSDTGSILVNLEANQLNAYGNSVGTSHGTLPIPTGTGVCPWVWVAIQRGPTANQWTVYACYDRLSWYTWANWAETLTIAAVGFRLGSANSLGIDVFDVVS